MTHNSDQNGQGNDEPQKANSTMLYAGLAVAGALFFFYNQDKPQPQQPVAPQGPTQPVVQGQPIGGPQQGQPIGGPQQGQPIGGPQQGPSPNQPSALPPQPQSQPTYPQGPGVLPVAPSTENRPYKEGPYLVDDNGVVWKHSLPDSDQSQGGYTGYTTQTSEGVFVLQMFPDLHGGALYLISQRNSVIGQGYAAMQDSSHMHYRTEGANGGHSQGVFHINHSHQH